MSISEEVCNLLAGVPVIVTGADGFIGRRFRLLSGANQPAPVFLGRTFDIVNAELPIARGAVVVHLAAYTSVAESWQHPLTAIEVNVLGTARVLEQARKAGASVVFVMSYPYGQPEYLPIDEEHPISALTPYHLGKIEAERITAFYASNLGVPVTSLRIFNVYGPGQGRDLVIGNIVAQLRDLSRPAIELDTLDTRRDFIFVDDVIRAISMAAKQQPGFRCFNVGSGASHSIAEIVRMAQEVAKDKRPVVELRNERRHEVIDVVADISRIRGELGWAPVVSMADGLSQCLQAETQQLEQP